MMRSTVQHVAKLISAFEKVNWLQTFSFLDFVKDPWFIS